jgi:hypothetical protein
MMKAVLISGLTLALFAGGAMAQQADAPPPNAPPPQAGMKAPPPGTGPEAADGNHDGPPPPPPHGPHDHHPPPPSKAAHFRLEQGDTRLDVKCADDEPMRACADVTLQMLDRLLNDTSKE